MLPDDDDDEVIETEEEKWITDEIIHHPTRDDWHEQRERGQSYEAVLRVHITISRIELTRAARTVASADPTPAETARALRR
jgi:hypothetical protein